MSNTLVLGASGQLGTAVARHIEDAMTPGRAEVDLATLTAGSARGLVESLSPDAVISCAAWTAVDAAEESEDDATAVNGTAVGHLAAAADRAGIPFVTFSTDYVFAGTSQRPYREDDPTSPVNAYGRSKLAGERMALQYPRSLVIRTSWVQSDTHPCFVRKMLDLAAERDELRVVDDQIGRPTFAVDLARATIEALELGASGLLHVANTGEASWYELASETLEIAGSQTKIVPVPSTEYETPAQRPGYSVLDTTRMLKLGMSALPPWQTTLRTSVQSIMQMYQ